MKKAVQYGAGNIGRGFIGQLFHQSGYEVVFIDVNTDMVNLLNEDRAYPVEIMSETGHREIIISNVRAVNGVEQENVAEEIADADIMATAVGVNVLQRIAGPIAAGLKKRWAAGNMKPLNIIICENLLDANHYLEGLLKKEMTGEEAGLFDETVGLVEASIGRMVPVMTPEMQKGNILRICVEEYCELPVDREAFKGEIPEIVNMVPFSPFDFYIRRKLFIHNMGHAITAYLGYQGKYRYIWEAVNNPTIRLIALKSMRESALALSSEYAIPLEKIMEHVEDLLHRFGNRHLGDTIERVGKDPIRKLSQNDRLVGSANLCIKHGILPVYISVGIAAALFYAAGGDEAAQKLQASIAEQGVGAVLSKQCGISSETLLGRIVLEFYDMIENGASLDAICTKAEQMKKEIKTFDIT